MGIHKYLSEKLVIKLNCPRSFIGGMLNAIACDLNENNNTKNNKNDQRKKFI